MAIEYISLKEIGETREAFKKSIKTFEGYVKTVNSAADKLNGSWDGKGSKSFVKEFSLMKTALDDISDILYEVYEAILDAETAYIDADEAVAKQISADS